MLKLLNTFLTCSGHIGKQYAVDKDERRTVTVWRDPKQVRVSAALDKDFVRYGNEAKERYLKTKGV